MFKNTIHKYESIPSRTNANFNTLTGVPRFTETWVAYGISRLLGTAALLVLWICGHHGRMVGMPEDGHPFWKFSNGIPPNSGQPGQVGERGEQAGWKGISGVTLRTGRLQEVLLEGDVFWGKGSRAGTWEQLSHLKTASPISQWNFFKGHKDYDKPALKKAAQNLRWDA